MNEPKIIVISILDVQTKLQTIGEIVEKHYHAKEPILIRVATEPAAEYLDKLLWHVPATSMLPHKIQRQPGKNFIAIGLGDENWNAAKILLNLHSEAHPNYQQFDYIYELLDHTSEERHLQAQRRIAAYPQAGLIHANTTSECRIS